MVQQGCLKDILLTQGKISRHRPSPHDDDGVVETIALSWVGAMRIWTGVITRKMVVQVHLRPTKMRAERKHHHHSEGREQSPVPTC
mgnify:CR=1 FL=1